MSNMTWVSLLNAGQTNQISTGAAYSNSTTATDISPGANIAGQALSIPAGFLEQGAMIRFRAYGIASTSGAPNLTLGVYWGGVAGTALATTGALATTSGLSNASWILSGDMRVESVGVSGSIRCNAWTSGIYAGTVILPASSSNGNLVTVNTGTTNILTIGGTWGTAATGNSIQVMQFQVETLN